MRTVRSSATSMRDSRRVSCACGSPCTQDTSDWVRSRRQRSSRSNTIASGITCSKLSVRELSHMDCLSYCRKRPASPQFAQSAQWCKQRYCIDLIYPILLLAVLLFALLSVGLPAVSSRWCLATAPHGLPVFIGGPIRSNFAAAVLPAVSSRWLSAAVPLASCFRRLPVPAAPPRRPGQQQTSSGGEKYSGLASNLAHLGRIC